MHWMLGVLNPWKDVVYRLDPIRQSSKTYCGLVSIFKDIIHFKSNFFLINMS